MFKAGDTVRLKSGGPLMTVSGYTKSFSGEQTNVVMCVWFDGSKVMDGQFLDAMVEIEHNSY